MYRSVAAVFFLGAALSLPGKRPGRLPLSGITVAVNAGHNRARTPVALRNGDGVGAYSTIGKNRMRFPGNPIAIRKGLHAGTIREADLTFDVARLLSREFRRLGARVILTRVEPCIPTAAGRLVNLKKRASVANRAGADLLIDLHANSWQPAGSGFMLFVPVPGKHLGEYRFGRMPASGSALYEDKKFRGSIALAAAVRRALIRLHAGGGIRPYPGPSWYGSGFKVIGYSRMPAVLLEMGAMDRPADMKRLAKAGYRRQLALSLAAAVISWVNKERKKRRL